MAEENLDSDALKYHSERKPGKIEVRPTKKLNTDRELALAYSPGVAAPCKAIAKDPSLAYKYTAKGNLVAVITNGSAVLGLGNIGALAGKPVMEGKGNLFKLFADIDVFDIELNCQSTEDLIQAIQALEPTFGGINLEDIAAPECFEIEKRLKESMNIPVFHDDQHGTAIISGAALLNAVHLTGKKLSDIKMVVNGAGASAIACTRFFISLGVNKENVLMCDRLGVIYQGRTEQMNSFKEEFAIKTERRSLTDALDGADVFVGLSVGGVLEKEMILNMAPQPIIFAMANPDPEILPDVARQARPDAIVATGRSDYPNQVNNVLGFPFIFRGALDAQATQINEEMKRAAAHALADLTREDVPDSVSAAYGGQIFKFGRDYIIPKPFDRRVLLKLAPAVAQAAMDSGVAQKPIDNFAAYHDRLERLLGPRKGFIRGAIQRVQSYVCDKHNKPRIVFPEGTSDKVLKSMKSIINEGVAHPILIGPQKIIEEKLAQLDLGEKKSEIEIISPEHSPRTETYMRKLYDKRHRKGVMLSEAARLTQDPYYFASIMVESGEADGMVCGASQNYRDSVRPILEVIGPGRWKTASGLNIVLLDDKILFFADTTVNIDPSADQLATIAIHASNVAEFFQITPRIAMLAFSNFSGKRGHAAKMKEAAQIVHQRRPDLLVDGEMQADTAVNADIMERIFPFCALKGGANILIFPNLESGNISYKLIQQLGGGEVLGPFLMGVRKPANVVQRTCNVDDIVNTVVLTALQSIAYKERQSDI